MNNTQINIPSNKERTLSSKKTKNTSKIGSRLMRKFMTHGDLMSEKLPGVNMDPSSIFPMTWDTSRRKICAPKKDMQWYFPHNAGKLPRLFGHPLRINTTETAEQGILQRK